MALDFVQIKWQLIRSLEASQEITKENVSLRQQVADLKVKLAIAKKEASKPSVSADFMLKLQMVLQNSTTKLRMDMKKLQNEVVTEFAEIVKMKHILTEKNSQLSQILAWKDREGKIASGNHNSLINQLQAAHNEIQRLKDSHKHELTARENATQTLREEVKRLKTLNHEKDQRISELEEKLEIANTEKTTLEKKLQVSSNIVE